MGKVNYVSKETLASMREELNKLKTVGRAEMAQAISEAREKGDLKENAEYDAAKEAQGLHEAKLAKLEQAIINARIIDPKDMDTSKISVLSKVKIKNLANKKVMQYQLVSDSEADLKSGKISISSPIGKGLLGKKVGDIAEMKVPAGKIKFEIVAISY